MRQQPHRPVVTYSNKTTHHESQTTEAPYNYTAEKIMLGLLYLTYTNVDNNDNNNNYQFSGNIAGKFIDIS